MKFRVTTFCNVYHQLRSSTLQDRIEEPTKSTTVWVGRSLVLNVCVRWRGKLASSTACLAPVFSCRIVLKLMPKIH